MCFRLPAFGASLEHRRDSPELTGMIPPELAHSFTHGARARGEAYVTSGRIAVESAEPLLVRAVAQGTAAYLVTLDAGNGRGLELRCSCPFAEDHGFCKHIWATLRVADNQGLLRSLLKAADGIFIDVSGSDDLYGDDALDLNQVAPLIQTGPPPPLSPPSPWRNVIDTVARNARYEPPPTPQTEWPNDRRLIYLADLVATASAQGLVIELATEKRGRDGAWGVPKLFRSGMEMWLAIPDPLDRQIGHMLRGSRRVADWARSESVMGFVLEPNAFDSVLRLMSETGRLRIRHDSQERPIEAAHWDAGAPWRIGYAVERHSEPGSVRLHANLERAGEVMPLDRPDLLHRSGFLVHGQTIALLDVNGPFALATELLQHGPITIAESELPAAVGALLELPQAPRLELRDDLRVYEAAPSPVPVLTLTRFTESWRRDQLFAALTFDYDGTSISDGRASATVFDSRNNRIVRRDLVAETAAQVLLTNLGVRLERDWRTNAVVLTAPASRLESIVRELTAAHWRVLIDGIAHRATTGMRAAIRSGVDWFDLEVGISFGDIQVSLPKVLEALRAKSSAIDLGNNGIGLIGDDVRQRLAPLLAMTKNDSVLRFRHSQTALLDALLEILPAVETDQQFEAARAALQSFERVEAALEPRTFRGELRPYQREGVGWFHFLRRFALGGCLADDMGLGKTVQVLALLESRRLEGAGPSLVVVPRSLVFNWQQEAERFTPELRVLDHTGVGRVRGSIALTDQDLLITTYGTLRRDIMALREFEFDYVILDEAQAIKNATTASAKAARLLRGRHRLALTGTPIENRVEELWSLFEFLNPGMLGTSAAFKMLARARSHLSNDAETALLARALRPVILRRTKERVAPELPARIEQTLMVELEPAQRRVYDELLAHYRRSLLPYVDRVGMARSRMKVLEALLRLRQAACHPALIARDHKDASSAKLDVLLPKLAEAGAEEHKALVFSQFTSFLALLRARLDGDAIPYAYLDGDTRDRQSVVERFENDASCRLFLISLRAGGQGLNLTAADYVFLLDPWWNPAVEAQAIDRAHRLGQQRRVIATRLVARDTIEEKILELQRSKRDLADAILSEDQGTLAKIGREELELLLA
jgi:superfamily II DNA or RNA helicase